MILTSIFGYLEPCFHERRLDQVGVVGGEVRPCVGEPTSHQHSSGHRSTARWVLDLDLVGGVNPDFLISLDRGTVTPSHVFLNEAPDVMVYWRNTVRALRRREYGLHGQRQIQR